MWPYQLLGGVWAGNGSARATGFILVWFSGSVCSSGLKVSVIGIVILLGLGGAGGGGGSDCLTLPPPSQSSRMIRS